MEKEILGILKTMQNNMKSMQSNMESMQSNMESMQGSIESIQEEQKETNRRLGKVEIRLEKVENNVEIMDNRLGKVESNIERVESKTDKNTLLLEDMNKKINKITEVHVAFGEQLDREKHEDKKTIIDRLDIIELAVTDTSSRVGDIQRDLSKMVRMTVNNWADIMELKSIK